MYVLEICLIGLFFIAEDASVEGSGLPQAIIMIVVLVLTVIFQWLLNDAFRPLFRYLPITLEDDAVIRDEEFARAQHQKSQRLMSDNEYGEDVEAALDGQERLSAEEERMAIEEEQRRIREYKRSNNSVLSSGSSRNGDVIMKTKPDTASSGDRWRQVKNLSQPMMELRHVGKHQPQSGLDASGHVEHTATDLDPQKVAVEPESQRAVGDVLYSGFSDELEDLTPEERDSLIRYSFQHSALRARKPVVWIPRDPLGISDDEIERCKKMSTVEQIDAETEKRETKTNIWMSNEGTALDAKGRVVFRRSPPDFSNVDLIAL